MIFGSMVELGHKRVTYSFSGKEGQFIVEGNCTFGYNVLTDASGSIYIEKSNPSYEGEREMIGSFAYSSFENERTNYSYNITKEYGEAFYAVFLTIVKNIENLQNE